MVIKSGSNAFHGAAFEFLRNNALDAPQHFDQGRVAPFKQNQFGANLGGRVIKDRTFFFFDYDGQRRRRSDQQFATIPNPNALAGNFSGLTVAGRATVVRDPFSANAPFPDNIIPASRISNVGRNFNQYVPAPSANLAQGNLTGNPASLNDFNQYHVKIDHRFSQKDSLFGSTPYRTGAS